MFYFSIAGGFGAWRHKPQFTCCGSLGFWGFKLSPKVMVLLYFRMRHSASNPGVAGFGGNLDRMKQQRQMYISFGVMSTSQIIICQMGTGRTVFFRGSSDRKSSWPPPRRAKMEDKDPWRLNQGITPGNMGCRGEGPVLSIGNPLCGVLFALLTARFALHSTIKRSSRPLPARLQTGKLEPSPKHWSWDKVPMRARAEK